MLQGDINAVKSYKKYLGIEITKADEQAFEIYYTQHKKILEIMSDIYNSKTIHNQAEKFAEPCVSEEALS